MGQGHRLRGQSSNDRCETQARGPSGGWQEAARGLRGRRWLTRQGQREGAVVMPTSRKFQPKENIGGGGGGILPTEECRGGVPQPLVREG